MIVGKGNRSGKDYTAKDKYEAFKATVLAVAKEQRRVDEIKADSALLIKETIDYWIEEYFESGDDKAAYTKEQKELIKIRVKEALKQDHTTRLALERELIMMGEAGEMDE